MSQNDKTSSTSVFPWKEFLAFLGVILAAYIGYLGIRSQIEIPIQATQTAEARLTLSAQTQILLIYTTTPTQDFFSNIPTSTSTLTPAPTEIILIDPEQFIREYYSAINNRQYDQTWEMLSVEFRKRNHPEGNTAYINFWNRIQYVEVEKFEIKERQGKNIIVSVLLKFTTTSGVVSEEQYTFKLIPNVVGDSWLID